MQSGCPQRLPLKSYLYRVIREYRFLVIVTLIKTNTLTISKVNGRNYLYCSLTPFALTNFKVSLGNLSYHYYYGVNNIPSSPLFLDMAGADC